MFFVKEELLTIILCNWWVKSIFVYEFQEPAWRKLTLATRHSCSWKLAYSQPPLDKFWDNGMDYPDLHVKNFQILPLNFLCSTLPLHPNKTPVCTEMLWWSLGQEFTIFSGYWHLNKPSFLTLAPVSVVLVFSIAESWAWVSYQWHIFEDSMWILCFRSKVISLRFVCPMFQNKGQFSILQSLE